MIRQRMDLHHRHLTSSQRAVIALESLPFLEKEAKERQGTRTDIVEIIPESSGRAREHVARQTQKDANLHLFSRDEIARMVNVSPRTVATVAKVEYPETIGTSIIRNCTWRNSRWG